MNYIEKLDRLKSLDNFINGEHQDDIILVLDKKYKKDKWSIICAVMNWFKVVESYLDSSKVLQDETNDNNWGNVYLYICAIDIVTKGINDLYQIVTNDNQHLFKGENDIFLDTNFDDNGYFQNIRAIFGAHPTELNCNGEYIVASYPTPYDSSIDSLRGVSRDWDYYTVLWSKTKSDSIVQKAFGFSFNSTDIYLEKYLLYLDVFYDNIRAMIDSYKEEMSNKQINKIDDIEKQLNLLIKKDEERLNGRNGYILEEVHTLITTSITDPYNENIYAEFKNKIISVVPQIYEFIKKPIENKNLDFLEKIIDCEYEESDPGFSYHYSKLMEYKNKKTYETMLLEYFKDKIKPFNNNIGNIEELFCLVKAYIYFKNN